MEKALASHRIGSYTLQPANAAVHAEASAAVETDWNQIVGLYDALSLANPSPVVRLNRAEAVAMRNGPTAALTLIDGILDRGFLQDCCVAHSARADLCRRPGELAEVVQPMKKL